MKNNTISLQTRILRSLFLFLGLIFVYLNPVYGQNCYVRLSDVSGITPTQAQLDSLEYAACRLRDSLPTEFQSTFKVYDFGFYLHNETMVGGYPEAFQKAIDLAQAGSPYYLLFGKQTDKNGVYTRFWVDLKLPSQAPFACVDAFKLKTIEQQIELVVNQKYQNLGASYSMYSAAEIAGIKKLIDIVFKYTDCCLCCGNKQTGCESCEYIDNSVAACVNNNATFRAQVENFISAHNCSEDAKEFASIATKIICENSNYKWNRFAELYEKLEQNAYFLLGNCIENDPHLDQFINLASFVVSGVALERINNSNGTWSVQSILDARGARVNLDYFPIIIDSMPIINGQRITGKQLFDYFRKNINDFAPKFDPYEDPYDSNLWLTDNPLGTVMHITMDTLVDGDVIASGYEECCWIFSTLRGPFYWGGYHPVSGNRQFGYKSENGKIVIYTRGADRTTTWYHSGGFEGNWEGETAFKKADNFWRSMQQKLSNFIIQNGGKVGYLYDYHYRPNWNQIKTQLTSNYPLTILTCE